MRAGLLLLVGSGLALISPLAASWGYESIATIGQILGGGVLLVVGLMLIAGIFSGRPDAA